MQNTGYRNIFSNFVDKEYVNMISDEGLDYAVEYSEKGGLASTCVAVGLVETENIGMSIEDIASELDVTRRGVYNARKDLDLIENEVRGVHKNSI